jgi:hypothetical protein
MFQLAVCQFVTQAGASDVARTQAWAEPTHSECGGILDIVSLCTNRPRFRIGAEGRSRVAPKAPCHGLLRTQCYDPATAGAPNPLVVASGYWVERVVIAPS